MTEHYCQYYLRGVPCERIAHNYCVIYVMDDFGTSVEKKIWCCADHADDFSKHFEVF